MIDSSGTNTSGKSSNEGHAQSCPRWCVAHEHEDIGKPDEFIVHCGPVRETMSADVQLRQVEWVGDGERDAVFVRIDDDFIPPMEAAVNASELAAVLVSVAAEAESA